MYLCTWPLQVISRPEIVALTEAFRSHESWALLSDRFLSVLQDCISRGNSKPATSEAQQQDSGSAAGGSSSADATPPSTAGPDNDADALLAEYQKLYAFSILVTLTAALNAAPQTAASMLSRLSMAPLEEAESNSSNSSSFLEAMMAQENNKLSNPLGAEILVHDVTVPPLAPVEERSLDNDNAVQKQYDSSDDETYEPLEPFPASVAILDSTHIPSNGSSHDSSTASIEVKVLSLASRLYFHLIPSPSAWQDGTLLDACGQCLAALRTHSNFLQLLPAAGAVCGLVHDRIQNNPQDLDGGLNAIVKGLDLGESTLNSHQQQAVRVSDEGSKAATVLALGIAASLAGRLPQGPSRRKLWAQVRDLWLPAAAAILERCEMERAKRTRRAKTSGNGHGAAAEVSSSGEQAEERHAVAVAACIAAFYVTDAPPGTMTAQLHDTLLASGIFRSLILSFNHLGKEPELESLRSAVLVCCAASSGLVSWAESVPGFNSAWQAPEFQQGGPFERYAAVRAALSGQPAGDAVLAAVLLGGDGEHLEKDQFGSEGVSALHSTLLLMDAVHRAARGRKEILLWGPATDTALQAASAALRSMDFSENAVRDGDMLDNTTQDGKEGVSREGHAVQLAMRRAKLIQPECLRLIKGLRAKPGSAGKSD